MYVPCVTITLQKLNGCFDLAVVILVAVLSDTKEDKSLPSLVILRKIKPCHDSFQCDVVNKTGMFVHV